MTIERVECGCGEAAPEPRFAGSTLDPADPFEVVHGLHRRGSRLSQPLGYLGCRQAGFVFDEVQCPVLCSGQSVLVDVSPPGV